LLWQWGLKMNKVDAENLSAMIALSDEITFLIENRYKMKPIELELAAEDITERMLGIISQYDNPVSYDIENDILKNMDELRDALDEREMKNE